MSPKKSEKLSRKRVLITAGPTREFLDPVRFLSNPSTGKMGIALAEEAVKRGARVTLVLGPSPFGERIKEWGSLHVIQVVSAQQMYTAVMKYYRQADIVIMAAAVGDWRPVRMATKKIKKVRAQLIAPLHLKLVPTKDILATVGKKKKKGQFLVGFAAETDHLLRNGQAKLKKKNCDLMVVNRVGLKGTGFGSETNQVLLLSRRQPPIRLPRQSKQRVAETILSQIENLYQNERV
ncbi:MAG: phosphopantothenoylcysteine decarboxylase [bacterium]|nr:phosphopantothenoylcysteine decarboxylase [bacterium]